MFLRFTKKNGKTDRVYRRAVFLNGSILVQHGDSIIAYAYRQTNDASAMRYVIEVAKEASGANVDCAEVSRYVKRFIGNAQKWDGGTKTRRHYEVLTVERLDMERFFIQKKKK